MLNRFFSNAVVQRSFYAIFLLLWSLKLLPTTLEYPVGTSSVGIPYALLYFPIALLLLAQVVFNKKSTWRIIFSFFIVASLFLLYDNFLFFSDYQTKMGSTSSDFIVSELLLLLVVSVVDFVLYKIRPAK